MMSKIEGWRAARHSELCHFGRRKVLNARKRARGGDETRWRERLITK